jgi:hypothetical protein
MAWGVANASAAGVDIGDACRNMLHIDARLPFVVFPRTSSPTSVLAGYVPGPASNSFLPPMITSAVGVKMAAQSAWTDSRSKLFKLTRAATVTLPGAPMVSQKEIVYSPDQNSRSGNRNVSHLTCPLMRYTALLKSTLDSGLHTVTGGLLAGRVASAHPRGENPG